MTDDIDRPEPQDLEMDYAEQAQEDLFWGGLADRLKKAREQSTMSQETLARKVGLSGPAIANYESGARKPSIYQLELLASALAKPINYFVGYSGTVPPPAFKREFLSLIGRLTEAVYLDNILGSPVDDDYCIPVPPDMAPNQTQYYRDVDPNTQLVTYFVIDKRRKPQPGDAVLVVNRHSTDSPFYPAKFPELRHPKDHVFALITAELKQLKQ